jgi:hypothetical protein
MLAGLDLPAARALTTSPFVLFRWGGKRRSNPLSSSLARNGLAAV